MKSAALTLSICALFATACGGAGMTPPPPPLAIATLAIGGGQSDGTGYVPLVSGHDVDLIPGEQGGFHVYLNIRVGMTDASAMPQAMVFDRQARRETTDELVSKARDQVPLVRSSDQEGTFEEEKPMRMFLCPSPVGIRVNDESLVVRVTAFADDTSEDALAQETIKLTPRCPEGDLAAFCAHICGG